MILNTQDLSGKTAIYRKKMSQPVRLILKAGYFKDKNINIFDLGHGRGDDIRALNALGYKTVTGYDPHHYNILAAPLFESDLKIYTNLFDWVHIGYVLNVLRSQADRVGVLAIAKLLLNNAGIISIAVRTNKDLAKQNRDSWKPQGDGFITTTGTFQKGYYHRDLVEEIEMAGLLLYKTISDNPLVILAKSATQTPID